MPRCAATWRPNWNWTPTGKPKLEEAKKLLEGKDFPKTLTYGYANNRDAFKNTGTVVQQNLKALGIEVELVPIPAPNYYSVLASEQLPDMGGRSGWCGGADPASVRTSADPLLGPNNEGTSYGFSNTSRYFDPVVSKAMFDLRNTDGTSEELGKKWSEAFGSALKTYPIVPLIRSHTNSVVAPTSATPRWATSSAASIYRSSASSNNRASKTIRA